MSVRSVGSGTSPVVQPAHAPTVVVIASAVAFSAASATATAVLVLAAFAVRFLGPVLDTFDDATVAQARSQALEWGVGILLVCAVADVAALCALAGHRWSQVVLLLLVVVAVLGGLVTAAMVLPLLVVAAGVAVLVLLLLPDSRRWFAGSG